MKVYAIYDDNNNLVSHGQCSTAKFNRIKQDGEKNITSFIVPQDIQNSIRFSPDKKEFFPAIISQEDYNKLLQRIENLEKRLNKP